MIIIRNHFLVNHQRRRRRRRCSPDDGQSGSEEGEEREEKRNSDGEEPNGEWAGERPIGLGRRMGIQPTERTTTSERTPRGKQGFVRALLNCWRGTGLDQPLTFRISNDQDQTEMDRNKDY